MGECAGVDGLLVALLAGGVAVVVIVAAIVVPRLTGEPARDGHRDDPQRLPRRRHQPAGAGGPGRSAGTALAALGQANDQVRAIVDRTDFRVRSRLLAAEIAAARPDLVGLQEVALWRKGPIELDAIGVPNATTVDYDFLDLLLAELSRRGVRYDVVAVQDEADVEGPAFPDPRRETGRTGRDVRLTLRDVILVRADAGGDRTRAGQRAVPGPTHRRSRRRRVRATSGGSSGPPSRSAGPGSASSPPTWSRRPGDHPGPGGRAAGRAGRGDRRAGADRRRPATPTPTRPTLRTRCSPAAASPTPGGPTPAPGFTFGLTETLDDAGPSFERRIDYVLARGLAPGRWSRARAR